MFFRRHKNVVQPLLAFVVVAITLWYFYKYYQENNIKLKAAKVRHHELLEERNRLSRELDGKFFSDFKGFSNSRCKSQERSIIFGTLRIGIYCHLVSEEGRSKTPLSCAKCKKYLRQALE